MANLTSSCNECDAQVSLGEGTEIGEIITCDDCGTELEVKGLCPVVLENAPQEEEDWGE
ncbi:lysine biosynthesis protein LysW [Patescibacteria group bacterium]|nr:lysine biosynthesis protein LysW [Patescibacteria group bacterium]